MARVKRKQYKLAFQDEGMEGVVITVQSLSSGQLIEIQSAQQKGFHERMTGMLADKLVGWNVEDEDGTPVPATLDGIRSMDVDFADVVVKAWMEAMSGVSRPLPSSSAGGQPSVELSIPMDVSLESLAS